MSQSIISPQLAYILDNPEDDTARLVYADYLEEQGEAARAEFIRTSIVLTKVKSECGSEGGDYLCRSMTCPLCPLIRRMNAAWLEIPLNAKPPSRRVDASETLPGFAFRIPFGPDHAAPVAHFHKGFVEILHCTVRQWLNVADDATARHPIREVYFTPHPPNSAPIVTYNGDGNRIRISVNSHHGISTVVRDGVTPTEIDETIIGMFWNKWRNIRFTWHILQSFGI